MAQPDYSNFTVEKYPLSDIQSLRIAIVTSEWNAKIIERMQDACIKELRSQSIAEENIITHSVPGSYELPLGAKYVLGGVTKVDAVICLGCVIKGQTKHDDYINHSIAQAISHLSLVSGTPVIFGVLTTNDVAQAEERSGGSHGNKGTESAIAVLKMLSLKEQTSKAGGKISF